MHRGRGRAGRRDRRGDVVNLKPFLVDALGSALELQLGTADDVLRHVTPDVLAQHLPRPLWARLLTACLGAPKVDAQLVVETVGIANLCEHVPTSILWACLSDIAARALGKPVAAAKAAEAGVTPAGGVPIAAGRQPSSRVPLAPPPPEAPRPRATAAAAGPSGPAIPPVGAEADDERPTRTSPQRFRQTSSGIARLGASSARRPQAQAAPVAAAPAPAAIGSSRRGSTEVSSQDIDIAVDDSQLVDWSTETTEARDDDFSDLGRKR